MFRCLLASRFSSTTVGILTATSAVADVGPDVDQTDSTTSLYHLYHFPINIPISLFHFYLHSFLYSSSYLYPASTRLFNHPTFKQPNTETTYSHDLRPYCAAYRPPYRILPSWYPPR